MPAPEISGTVKDPQGKPVEGVVVVARPVSSRWDRDPLVVRTDATGAFRIELDKRTPTRFEVQVYASPFAPRRFEKVQPGTRLDVRLEKGRTVEGTIRDGAGGAPVAGARVEAHVFGVPLSGEPEVGQLRAVADSKGRYRLQGLGPGRHTVTATARGFGRASRATGTSGQPVDLFLLPGGAITGTVVGPDKKPRVGAIVHAEHSDQRWKASSRERTDAEGRFEILGLDPGSYDLLVRLQGHAPGLVSGIEVANDGETRADVMLEPGASVEGRLVDSSEKPIPGHVVAQELNQQLLPNEASTLLRADAGIDGRFRIDGVPSGSLAFKAMAPGFAPRDVNVEVPARETEVAAGDFVLDPGTTIRGHVRDRSGNGIADAEIGGIGPGRPQARSEADGSYVLAGLEAGAYTLFVSALGFGGTSRREVEAGTVGGEADFVLDAVGTVTGLVVDDRGRPIESYAVSLHSKDGRHDGRGSADQVDPADGRFVVDVGPGEYVATISATDYADGVVPNIRVASGTTTEVGRVRLGSGGLLRGVVVTADGAPVAGATVQAGRSEEYVEWKNQAQSDANGSFEMRGLPAGRIDVLAQHPSFADGHVAGIDIDPAKGPAETKLVLGRGGRIEGFARRRDGSPLAGASVWFEPARIEGREILSGSPRQLVALDGSFSIERVPPGHGNVILSSHAERDPNNRSSHAVPVEIREGETTAVELVSRGVQVSGRVSRSGVAAPGVRLRLSGRWPSHAHGSATTAEDGTYSLTGTAGPATLAITAADGKSDHGWRQVILPDVEAYTLDLDIRSSAALAGLVVDDETGSPVAGASVFAALESSVDGANLRDARTDADGRFRVEVAPGDYVVRAGADGYAVSRAKLAVRETGADLRLALVRGRVLRGRVVDASGRPAAGVTVAATPVEDEREPSDGTETLPDGTFRLSRLATRPYHIVAGSPVLGFAARFPVSPGDDTVELVLQPAATLLLRLRAADGGPVAGAWARRVKLNGVAAADFSAQMDPSDAQGQVRLHVPAGSVEVVAQRGNLKGRTTVGVGPGDSASGLIVLKPEANPSQ